MSDRAANLLRFVLAMALTAAASSIIFPAVEAIASLVNARGY